jgi:hypothetical protein
MTAQARSGVGAIIKITSTSPHTVVGEVTNIDGPQESIEQTEVTTLDSTGGFKEFTDALKDGGTVTIPILWINTAAQRAFRNLFGAATQPTFEITLPTSPLTLVSFAGRIASRNWTVNPADPMQAEVQIKVSGEVTFTP